MFLEKTIQLTLGDVDNYHLFSGDTDWLLDVWANYTKAVAFLEGKVDSSGLMNVTGLRDWARQGGGGHNAEGNAILYRVCNISRCIIRVAHSEICGAHAGPGHRF